MNISEQAQEHMKQILLADEAVSAASDKAERDEYRLQYHVMPPAGWMNDPNGLVHFKGEYHLFYQHHPYSDKWGPMHWGHAVSKDLVHWRHLPIALAPTEPYELGETGGYGCWSGSAVEHEGELTLFYTGHVDGRQPMEVQCAASSTDGIVFRKHPNPVIHSSPDEENIGFRDPKVWCHDETFYMIIGSGKAGKGKALLYRSEDLEKWEYMGVAAESDGTQGDMWECPDLFPLGDGHALILSPMNMEGVKNLYMTGEMDYAAGQFTPQVAAKLDYGPDFYAAQTLMDDQGRRILIAWMDRWGSSMVNESRGWYGAMTLPRELLLKPDGTLAQVPVPELEKLRGNGESVSHMLLEGGQTTSWKTKDGQGFEWIAEFNCADSTAHQLDITLLASEDGSEATVITYIPKESRLILDCNRSGRGEVQSSEALLPASSGELLKLHVFVDRCSIEVFVNDGDVVFTSRIYPAVMSGGLQIKPEGGAVILQSLKIWSLNRI
ncbi:glycoside hydrolase family 32 protein [Paenibacillus wynnii]|uniref:glycoside hydrolase family 32 protein n=1 Tax=Paenibacillus wynnii TaxID=268407 RepID=UPI002791609A|nr:glycoside hydrolase family 32 protein [Paenibacillus wynnii]MDQ0194665.1 beta-fructofuranosidase [Paenibacillus wynnii]